MRHDPAATPTPVFPRLTPTNHHVTSPPDPGYNCIAWAAGDTARWWQPDLYWPIEADPGAYSVADLMAAYEAMGFERCGPGDAGELVAIYGDAHGEYTHAARRLPTGRWTSKLGTLEDIEHETPEDVAGGDYGTITGFMRRGVPPAPGAVS